VTPDSLIGEEWDVCVETVYPSLHPEGVELTECFRRAAGSLRGEEWEPVYYGKNCADAVRKAKQEVAK
jgi:hypothetical protein